MLSLLSLAESEHLLQPSEASVWERAALVWCLHHRHWFGPLLQVRCLKYSNQSMFVCPSLEFDRLSGSHGINLCICKSILSPDRLWLTVCLYVPTQKENHVPKHCECHRADDRWEGGHCLYCQQPCQEGNRHVCISCKQETTQLFKKCCPVYFKNIFVYLKFRNEQIIVYIPYFTVCICTDK